ncbi:MxcI protein [Cystobacter fuscus]|uniref:MxcI protein n=1 Tax=Cystobacter fuscus TaxID=43 RepID=UPI002B2A599E|nr:MxcI protein [Cystobacter fuscus]
MNRTPLFRSSRLAATALSLSLLAGCDPEPTPPAPTDPNGPRYALVTQVLTADEPTSYIVVTNKVDQAAALSLDNAIQVPGRALGVGIGKSGSIFVGVDEGSKLTRYTLSDNGTLQENGTVSFDAYGVKTIGEYQGNFQFVSPTKAYYFDGTSSQAIVWNPTDMSVTKAIKLEGLSIAGSSIIFSPSPVQRANQVIMPVGWRVGPTVTKMAGVVSIDTRTDTATIVKDERCGYVHSSVLGADGQVYLATEVYGSAAHRLGPDNNPAPCLLKFNPDTLQFDPSFYKDLNSLAGGAVTGALLPGPQGTTYVRVLDESIPPQSSFSSARVLASGAGWQWWKVDTTTWTATKQDAFPATTGSTFFYEADNQILYSEFVEGSSTTLHLLGDNGKPTVSTLGLAFSFLQLR